MSPKLLKRSDVQYKGSVRFSGETTMGTWLVLQHEKMHQLVCSSQQWQCMLYRRCIVSDCASTSGLYLPMVTPHLSFTATSAHNGELCKIGNTISFNTKSSTATVVWLLLLLPSLYRLLK